MSTKEKYMTFRVDEVLRADFHDAVKQANQDSDSAKVLREFMRFYVDRAKASAAKRPVEVDSERMAADMRRRERAVAFARASVGLEGFKPSQAAEQAALEFIMGRPSVVAQTARDSAFNLAA